MSLFDIQTSSIAQGSLTTEEMSAVSKQLIEIMEPLSKFCDNKKQRISAADMRLHESLNLATQQYLPSGKDPAAFVIMVANERGTKTPAGFAILSVPVRASYHESFIYKPSKTGARSYALNDVAEIIVICGQKGSASALLYEMTQVIKAEALYLEVAGGRIGTGRPKELDPPYDSASALKAIKKGRTSLVQHYREKYGFEEVFLLHRNRKDSEASQLLSRMAEPANRAPQDSYLTQTNSGVPYSMLVDMKTLRAKLPGFSSAPLPAAAPLPAVKVPAALPAPAVVDVVKSPVKVNKQDKEMPVVAPPPAKVPQNQPARPRQKAARKQQTQRPRFTAAQLAKAVDEKAILPPVVAVRGGPRIPVDRFIGAPSASEKKAEKKRGRGRGKPRRVESYKSMIYRVLKDIHPDVGINNRAMSIMNSIVNDMFNQLAAEARLLVKMNHKQTMKDRDIQTAVRLIFGGQLARHAVSDGTKAVTKYTNSYG